MTAFTSKMTICVFILLLASFNLQAQPAITWGKQYGSSQEEYVRNHVTGPDGKMYVTGNTRGDMSAKNFGKNDGFITKLDTAGNILWSRQFGSEEDEDIQWSAIDKKGNVYITGTTKGNLQGQNKGKEDFFLVKYSPEGEKAWTRQFGTDSSDVALGIYLDISGLIYLTGSTRGLLGKSSSGGQDAFIMKLDNNGKTLNTCQFGTPAPDVCMAITGDNKGRIYVSGSTFGKIGSESRGFMDVFAGQFDEDLKPLKFTQFGSEGFDIPTSMLVDKDLNIYVGGSTSGNFAEKQLGEGDCFLIKISKSGDVLWNKQFGTAKHDGIKSIAFNNVISGNILVSGLQGLPPAHAFVSIYNVDGNLVWEKNIIPEGDSRDASGKDVSIDNDGNIYHLGLTQSNLFSDLIGITDFYLVKMKLNKDSSGK